jgi:RNA polymerase sigma factor (sigma-70 family)
VLSNMNDNDLLSAYTRDGDKQAFKELERRYTPMVQSVCRSVVGDSQSTDDAVEETFALLMTRASSLGGNEPLEGWLRVAALGRARHHRRGKLRQNSTQRSLEKSDETIATASSLERERELVTTALQILPVDQRQALILRYVEGRPEDEVARTVGCPAGILNERISIGISKLKIRLRSQGRQIEQTNLITLLGTLAGDLHQESLMSAVAPSTGKIIIRRMRTRSIMLACLVIIAFCICMAWLLHQHIRHV